MRLLEVEIHSHCNRKCPWCANKFLDRTGYEELPKDVYTKLLYDLREKIDVISFSRYNEPLYNKELLIERIELAREILPEVKLVFNTNGDFLDDLNFDIDELTIMDYDNMGLEYWVKKLSELNAFVTLVSHSKIHAIFEDMLILVELNWSARKFMIEDRGGLLKQHALSFKNDRNLRDRPCYEPMYFIGVDYNGSVVPCCNIRSDAMEHAPFILGNINETSILEIINSSKRTSFILDCIVEHFNAPCLNCQKDPGRYVKKNGGIYS